MSDGSVSADIALARQPASQNNKAPVLMVGDTPSFVPQALVPKKMFVDNLSSFSHFFFA